MLNDEIKKNQLKKKSNQTNLEEPYKLGLWSQTRNSLNSKPGLIKKLGS
jgi:hypothetical protein